MTGKKTAALIQNPGNVWRTPADILKDRRLSEAEKLAALRNWEADETALLRADDENMPLQRGRARAVPPEDMIADIQRIERKITNQNH